MPLRCLLFIFFFVSLRSFSQPALSDEQIKTNRIKRVTTWHCESRIGQPDSCYVSSINEYDSLGREVRTVSAIGKPAQYEATYSYDAKGNIVGQKRISGKDTVIDKTVSTKRGAKTYENGQLRFSSRNKVNHDGLITSSRIYNGHHEFVYGMDIAYNDRNMPVYFRNISPTDTMISKRTFDERGRLVNDSTFYGNGKLLEAKTYVYGKDTLELERVSGEDGHRGETRYVYDEQLRLVRKIVRDSSGSNNSSYTTRYSYDANGNKTEEEGISPFPPVYHRLTHYEYDSKGNCVRSSTSSFTEQPMFRLYSYDQNGKLTDIKEVLARDTNVTHYTYDKNGRKIREDIDDHGITMVNTFRYDDNGFLVGQKNYMRDKSDSLIPFGETVYQNNAQGMPEQSTFTDVSYSRMLKVYGMDTARSFPLYTLEYQYNGHDSLVSTKQVSGSGTFYQSSEQRRYGTNGKVLEIVTYSPDGKQVRERKFFEYDSLGNCIATKTFRGKDSVSSVVVRYAYDAQHRLTDAVTFDKYMPPMTKHIRYEYNADGKLVAEKEIPFSYGYVRYEYETY